MLVFFFGRGEYIYIYLFDLLLLSQYYTSTSCFHKQSTSASHLVFITIWRWWRRGQAGISGSESWMTCPRTHSSKTAVLWLELTPLFYLFFKDLYLFVRDTQREAETQAEGEAGSMQGAGCRTPIPGLQDHTQSQRQTLNHWATQVSLLSYLQQGYFNLLYFLYICPYTTIYIASAGNGEVLQEYATGSIILSRRCWGRCPTWG